MVKNRLRILENKHKKNLDKMLNYSEYLIPVGPTAPKFLARGSLPITQPPVKYYFHSAGLNQNLTLDENIGMASADLVTALFENKGLIAESDYALALLWAQNGARMVDLLIYHGINKWRDNPGVISFVFRNGVYQPEKREITCGDGTIIIGREEEHRRTTRDLAEFMKTFPKIPHLRAGK